MAKSEYRVKGDGGNSPLPQEDLTWLQQEVSNISSDAKSGIWDRRENTEGVRYCSWDGQSPDGKKHRGTHGGAEPFPFEGASDARIRTADSSINFIVGLLVQSATRGDMSVTGMESLDNVFAGKIGTLLKWVIRNQLGSKYRRELEKIAQYICGDSPGVAVMGVFWEREIGIEMKDITVPELIVAVKEQYMKQAQQNGQELDEQTLAELEVGIAEYITALVEDPEMEEEGVEWLLENVSYLKKPRAKKVLRELREKGLGSFPQPFVKNDRPIIEALRLYDDIFLPTNTPDDIQRSRVVYKRQWLTKVQVQEKLLTDDWNQDFITRVIGDKNQAGQEGQTGFIVEYSAKTEPIDIQDVDEYAGLYEIIYAYYRAVNEDGIPGVYVVPFHFAITDQAAKDREILDYAHGQYPFVPFQREVISSQMFESRGMTEIVSTHQNALKLLCDSFLDNTSLSTVPPVKGPQKRPAKFKIRPAGYIQERRKGDLEYMAPPAYPRANDKMQDELRRQVGEYFGIPTDGVDPGVVQVLQQMAVDRYLGELTDTLLMVVQLSIQYLDDDIITRIVGGEGIEVDRSGEAIRGKFDLGISFDVRDLSMEMLKVKAELISAVIVPLDKDATIKHDQLVAWLMQSVDPNLAEKMIRPIEEANASEAEDEKNKFAQIKAGIEPPMEQDGENYQLRQQVNFDIIQSNPSAFEDMSDMSKEIWRRRMQHFSFMLQQEENAQIGRVGAKPALDEEGGIV